MGISGSSLLLVGTSLLTYLVERKRLLNEISLMVHKYGNLFNGIEWFDWQYYYDDDTFKSKGKYNEYIENKNRENIGLLKSNTYKYIQPYAKIVDMDFENYVCSENDLFFICFWNTKELQSWFKVNVFDYLSNYWNKTLDLITNYNKNVREGKVNFDELYGGILKLQNEIGDSSMWLNENKNKVVTHLKETFNEVIDIVCFKKINRLNINKK